MGGTDRSFSSHGNTDVGLTPCLHGSYYLSVLSRSLLDKLRCAFGGQTGGLFLQKTTLFTICIASDGLYS